MLLFITGTVIDGGTLSKFQYISCYSLSYLSGISNSSHRSFNTSHVTLYLEYIKLDEVCRQKFQYISCYSLSRTFAKYPDRTACFQYISCYSLSLNIGAKVMITVKFQYISCYSLSRRFLKPLIIILVSIHLMLLFICNRECACAVVWSVSIHLMLLFIGEHMLKMRARSRSFNTSHVTLYRELRSGSISIIWCFNTSHVTLYLLHRNMGLEGSCVSIHLMLLFIRL